MTPQKILKLIEIGCRFSISKSCLTLQPHGLHTVCQVFLSFTISQACSNSCPLSRWCHPTISSFSSCPPSFPASGPFPMSQLFASDGQSIRASTSASFLPVNIQDWLPLGLTGLFSLQSKHKYKYLINMGKCSKGLIKWLILFSFLLEYNWFTMLY